MLVKYKCPYCGQSMYQELFTQTTLVYVPKVYIDGKLVNDNNPNESITHYRCLNCDGEFTSKNSIISNDDYKPIPTRVVVTYDDLEKFIKK